MSQERPPNNANAEHLRGQSPLPQAEEVITSALTPNRFWRMLTDPRFSPPVTNPELPVVTTKAFLGLTHQVQALAGMAQTIVPYLPQLIQLITSQSAPQTTPLRVESPTAPIREDQPDIEGQQRPTTEVRSDSPVAIPTRSRCRSRDSTQASPDLDTLSSNSTDSLREQVRQVHQRLDKVQKEFLKSKEEFRESSKGRSPFILEIQDKSLPANFRLPSLELYDDSCDLIKHVATLRAQMALYDTFDALMCRVFLMGLKPSRFFWSLIERPPMTVPEMLQRAHQYIAVEALVASKQDESKRPRAEQPRGQPSGLPKRRIDGSDMLPPRPPPVPLNSTRTEISLQIRERGLLKTPNPMKTRSERCDKRKYCHFHREHGHDTEECRDLQNQIEDLIRQEHLRRYVLDQPTFPDNRPPRDSSSCPKGSVEKQIDVIIGGLAFGGDNSYVEKAYTRTMMGKRPKHDDNLDITFGSGNEEYPDHDDALVISTRMANASVKRVMINMRSSTDIMYLDAFQKLGLTDKDLVSLTSALTGFTRDSISPLGVTTIHVTFGEEPKFKTLMVSFMVVGLPLAYNVIIG
ncbi:hypothetical protein BHM03_00046479 [Ensete ventricosum]|nr:hypothetical protein BHM03_00046479 [Ensete ventricosum]